MRELFSNERNISHAIVDGVVIPQIEAVLSVYGRHTEFVGAGIAQAERSETIRIRLDTKSARKFAVQLNAWADEAEKQASSLAVKKEVDQ